MPSYIVTMKQDAPKSEIDKVKADITGKGGKIKHEYTLIKGFAVEFPEDQYTTLSANPHVATIENDGIVTTQLQK